MKADHDDMTIYCRASGRIPRAPGQWHLRSPALSTDPETPAQVVPAWTPAETRRVRRISFRGPDPLLLQRSGDSCSRVLQAIMYGQGTSPTLELWFYLHLLGTF